MLAYLSCFMNPPVLTALSVFFEVSTYWVSLFFGPPLECGSAPSRQFFLTSVSPCCSGGFSWFPLDCAKCFDESGLIDCIRVVKNISISIFFNTAKLKMNRNQWPIVLNAWLSIYKMTKKNKLKPQEKVLYFSLNKKIATSLWFVWYWKLYRISIFFKIPYWSVKSSIVTTLDCIMA